MAETSELLKIVYAGWNGYNQSMVNAVTPLTPLQLRWRPTENHHSVGELVRHISLGRITWFVRMDAPGSQEISEQISDWELDGDGNRYIVEDKIDIAEHPAELVRWLEMTWQMIALTLSTWKISDLSQTYRHVWNGDVYAVSRQWTIWRILSHDIHHGGELSLMLGIQGIEAFELGALFGHIILPPLWHQEKASESVEA